MPATEKEQAEFLRDLMSKYFARLAAISEASEPPGVNAANGHWRDETFADQQLKDLETRPNLELSGPFSDFYGIFAKFQSGIRTAFANENYEAKWITNLTLFWDVFKEHAKDLLDVFIDIRGLFDSDEKKQEAARDKLFADIEKLVKKVEDSKTIPQGKHANGNISIGANAAALEVNKSIPQVFPTGAEAEAGKLAVALRAVCSKLLTLKTDGHDPWLRAEWQVSYQAITKGAAEALSF